LIEDWGEAPDGSKVQRVKISRNGLSAHLLTFGATLQDIYLAGCGHSLVLGYPVLAPYLKNPNYFGATVGRYANRIKKGRAVIDGEVVDLDRNALDKHHLHGGSAGASFRNWELLDHTQNKVVFGDLFPDGHMGFPGALSVVAVFEITENKILRYRIEAQSDAPTLCNFTSHNYFNLDGRPDIRDHHLRVFAETYLPVDLEGIPTGNIEPVIGTRFDFTKSKKLLQGDKIMPLDHNFCLKGKDGFSQRCASLFSERSHISVELSTTEPGLQVYSGEGITENNHTLRPFSGIALEPQIWPDAPNHKDFPNAELRPGEKYVHSTSFRFHSAV